MTLFTRDKDGVMMYTEVVEAIIENRTVHTQTKRAGGNYFADSYKFEEYADIKLVIDGEIEVLHKCIKGGK